MKPSPTLNAIASLAAALSVSACETLDATLPQSPMRVGHADVTPVMTEHSFGLQCLGALIDEAEARPIVIEVDSIRDRTIPERLNDRSRLSQASDWLVITAISKMETPRVRSTRDSTYGEDEQRPAFKIDGAWTQDDELLRQSSGLGDLRWLTGRLNLEGERKFDYIAGDFVTERNGVIEFSTAIGVFVGADEVDARLLVDDGVNSAEIGFEASWADGPQLAQRRVAEAATLIHVARFYGIDYRPCLESGLGDPGHYRSSLDRYAKLDTHGRYRAAQSSLASMGLNPGSIDGVWGRQSRGALMAYQNQRGLPVTGTLSPAIFALLESDSRRGWHASPAQSAEVHPSTASSHLSRTGPLAALR